jgi:RND family efflux transporter MFP subunit
MNRFARCVMTSCACIVLLACGESESTREARQIAAATPQRLRPDGSIQLTAADRTALGLVTVPAAEGDLPESALRFGRVLSPPVAEARVVSPITGRITRPPFVQVGAAVRSGVPMLEIMPVLDTPDRIAVGAQTAEREGQIEAAGREVAKAETDALRARALSPQIVSAAKLQEAETALATARARLDGLRGASAASEQAQMRAVTVTAPIAGLVSAINVAVGALVNRGDVLAQIVAAGPRWIDLLVPPDDPPGNAYEVSVLSGFVPARLLARGVVVETDGTRHDRLVVDAPRSTALSVGSTVSVYVSHGTARGIVVPESALVPGVDTDTVFVEASPGMFAPRPVRVVSRFAGKVRLEAGVKAGEPVVVQGTMSLQGERLRSQLRGVD